MKRARPRQHLRRLKSGRITKVNRGIRRRIPYGYLTNTLKGVRSEVEQMGETRTRLKEKLNEPKLPLSKQIEIIDKLEQNKREIMGKQAKLDHINKTYFPKNKR